MFVVDITRDNATTDMLCGNDSMDAKNKTLNYIINYAFANHNILIDKKLLDLYLNIDSFSLNNFLKENYSTSIDNDLLVQSIVTDKDNCIFVKYMDDNTNMPLLYSFNKNNIDTACNYLVFLANDGLINKYQDDLSEYEKRKLDYNNKNMGITNYDANIKGEVISLYNNKGLFLEELLTNAWSLNELKMINNYNVKI